MDNYFLKLIFIIPLFIINLYSQTTYDNWDFQIKAQNIQLTDTLARFGIRSDATTGFDNLYDFPRPPRSPSGNYLEVYFPHSGGNYPPVLGSKYATDYQSPNDPIWNLSVESSIAGLITLFWDSSYAQLIETRVQIYLLDISDGNLTNMRIKGSYTFSYTAKRNFQIVGAVKINLKYLMEAFWNGTSQIQDTVVGYLANHTTPFNFNDSAKVNLTNLGQGWLIFPTALTGNYYLTIKHRNHIEIWSSLPISLTKGTTSFSAYDFSNSATTAYGIDALKQVGDVFVSWVGDVNQDIVVNFIDRNLTWNNRNQTGYIPTDCNGDNITDAADYTLVLNNRLKLVQRP